MNQDKDYYDIERRVSVRWEQAIPAKFSFIDGERDILLLKEIQNGVIHNISSGGVCIEVFKLGGIPEKEFTDGKIKVLVEIAFGQEEPIWALAKAAWLNKLWKEKTEKGQVGEYLMGLQFTDITTKSRDRIIEYILNSYLGKFKV